MGFSYRSKLPNPQWHSAWDWALFVGGAVPAVVLSLAAGNLMIGLPFQLDADLRSTYSGSFWGLFQPFPLLCVIVGVALLFLHGAVFLHWRTEAELAHRARRVIVWSALVFTVSFVAAGIWIAFGVEGYRITSLLNTMISVNPVDKTVKKALAYG